MNGITQLEALRWELHNKLCHHTLVFALTSTNLYLFSPFYTYCYENSNKHIVDFGLSFAYVNFGRLSMSHV